MTKRVTAGAGDATAKPKTARKPRAKKSKIILPESSSYSEALLGQKFTHEKRAEWGVGTVIAGTPDLVVLSWSDGLERRTARSYLDHLKAVP